MTNSRKLVDSAKKEMKDEVHLLDNSWKLIVSTDKPSSGRSWAKIRPLRNPNGEYYADVLFGDRGEGRPHSHIGVPLDGSQEPLFVEGRGTTHSIKRSLRGKRSGFINFKETMLSNAPSRSELTFKVIMQAHKKTVRLVWGANAISDKVPTKDGGR